VLVLGSFAAIVTSGLLNRSGPGGPPSEAPAAAAVESPARAAARPVEPQPSAGEPAMAPVSLRRPYTGEPLSGATVAVEGTLRVRAASVEIVLEGRGKQALVSRVVNTTDPHGGIRPIRSPVIDVELLIPSPRPVGRAWVVVTAYDRFGGQIGAMYRVVQVGELARGPAG
jgi:hypothetical protein